MDEAQTEHFRLARIVEWRDYFVRPLFVSHEPRWHTLPISALADLWLRHAVKDHKILLRIDVLPLDNLVLNIGIRVSIVDPQLSKSTLAIRLDSREEQDAMKALYEETICLLQYRKQALLLDAHGRLSLEELARHYDRW